jgi:cell division protein FtsB
MQEQPTTQNKVAAAAEPLRQRALAWMHQAWRPAGTGVAVLLALLIGWGVVNGKHGLSAWQKQRVEHKQLQQEIKDLQDENTRMRNHIDRLKSDPDAIEHAAREQLHYARPGEVIVALPPDPKSQPAKPANP